MGQNNNRDRRPNNNQQRQPNQQQTPVTPAEDTVVQANGTTTEEPAEKVETLADSATAAEITTAPEQTETEADQVEDEAPTEDQAADEATGEEEQAVTDLKELLANFVEANKVLGTEPKDFAASAKAAALVVKHVGKYPRNTVLTALLDFFIEHKDGAAGQDFMKGSTTLDKPVEQRVGFIYGMFSALANGQRTRIEPSKIIQVLGKPEFVTFWQQRQRGIAQNG